MKIVNKLNVAAFLMASAALPALAQEASHGGMFDQRFAACLGLGIAALGGAFGQAKIAAAALDGIARNPGARDKIFTPMIIGLALVESLVIYAFVIALTK